MKSNSWETFKCVILLLHIYKHNIVQHMSRSYSSCITLPLAPGNHSSILCFHEFYQFAYAIKVEACSICHSVTGLITQYNVLQAHRCCYSLQDLLFLFLRLNNIPKAYFQPPKLWEVKVEATWPMLFLLQQPEQTKIGSTVLSMFQICLSNKSFLLWWEVREGVEDSQYYREGLSKWKQWGINIFSYSAVYLLLSFGINLQTKI